MDDIPWIYLLLKSLVCTIHSLFLIPNFSEEALCDTLIYGVQYMKTYIPTHVKLSIHTLAQHHSILKMNFLKSIFCAFQRAHVFIFSNEFLVQSMQNQIKISNNFVIAAFQVQWRPLVYKLTSNFNEDIQNSML